MKLFAAHALALAALLGIAVSARADSVVTFNEIHYHPDTAEASREYIELHNQMAVDVDMSGWRISGGVDFTFPAGTVIAGRGHLVVAVSPAGVQAAYGVAGALGPWTGRLSNNGEELRLRDNSDRVMDEVAYGSDGKWPAGADGSGASLSKTNAGAASDDPSSWAVSYQKGGTPGAANFPDPNAPFIPPSGLVSWWRMDEASGATTADSVGGNTGTLGAGATRVAGLTGTGALSFDNTTTAFVNAGAGANLAVTGGISIEAVIKPTWDGTGTDTVYGKNNAAVAGSLAAFYAFDEAASGTTPAIDATGGPSGTFIGTATRAPGLAGSTGAARFNNTNGDGVNIGTGLSFTTGLTIVARIKPTWNGAFANYDEIFRKEDGNNRILFSFQNDSNNGGASPPVAAGPVLSFGLGTAGVYRELDMPLDGASGRPTLAQLKDGNPHHVAVTYDAATGVKAIYVDGTLRHSTTHSGNIASGGGAAAVIGNVGPGGGEPFTGDIDEFAMFRVALTAGQIANLSSGANTPLNVVPGTGDSQRVTLEFQNDGNNAAASPPVAAGPVLSFGLNTGSVYRELDMPLDGASGRPTFAQLTDGQRHHITASYDSATGTKAIFVDGTLRYSTTHSGSISASGTAPATLGNIAPSGATPFTGTLDEVAYWSRALAAGEVATHWTRAQSGEDYFALQFNPAPPPSVRLNEIGAAGAFFIEVQNTGATPLNLAGWLVRVTGLGGGDYAIPAQTIAPGALLALTPPLTPAVGAKVFLLTPSAAQLADSIEVAATARGRTDAGEWAYVSGTTQGAANTFSFQSDIVINEIMYHPRPIPGAPAVTQSSTLVPFTATWKYRDDGVDLGTAWRGDAYNDAAWLSGTGMFSSSIAAYAPAVLADSPLAYWRLDDATTSIADASGNNRTGTATAGVTLGGAALVSDGPPSRAITLTGANRITIPGFEKIGPGGYSVEYWVKVLTAPAGFMNLVGDGESGGDFFMMNYLSPGLNIRPHYGTGNAPVSLDSVSALSAGQTYHIVTTWNAAGGANNGVIYINGIADRSTTVSGILPTAGTTGNNTVFIGFDNREPASGSYVVDEVAVYNSALSPARVAVHYALGAPPSPRKTTLATGSPTHYFRTTFNFTGNAAATELFINLASDDGAVVYLNGVEIVRDNMPGGAVSFATAAASEKAGASLSGVLSVPAGALRVGSNVLAVEVHQAAGGNSDVFMGLELTARETLTPAIAPAQSANTWVELHNRGGSPVVLTGWRLDDGADFAFAPGTSISPGQFLVMANDPVAFAAAHPGIAHVGPLLNNLSRGGERILLRDAAGNIADRVTYADAGRWPVAADGGGSSLELRAPNADNDAPEAWAASDESSRAGWQTITYRATTAADGGPTNFNEFVLGLLDEGEVLIDDVHVVSQPGTGSAAEMLTGGDFESGGTAWRLRGTHRTSAVIPEPGNAGNHVLRVTSTGGTDVLHNNIETTFTGNTAIVDGREYEISFRAKWVRGADLLNTRLYWNRCARVTRLATPANGGTPGAVNSRLVANIGPTFRALRHTPAVPAASQAATVSIETADPDNVASATLFYSINGGAFTSISMTSSSGTWSAAIPGQSAGTIAQFYVLAADGLGATATFPVAGASSRALVQWDNGLANLPLAHNIRLILTATDNALLFTNSNLLADDLLGGTLIYDESEVFHNVGVRLKGSEHGRADPGRQGYHVEFPPDRKFRGVHDSITLDRSGNWGYAGAPFGQNEMLVKHIISHAGGVASLQDDIVRLIAPQTGHTGPALLQMARYGGDYLDSMYQDGSDGQLHKMEIAYHTSATDNGLPTGLKLAQEGGITNVDLGDRGASAESYRWFFRHENNPWNDDSSAMMGVSQAFSQNGAAFDAAIDPLIDNDEWMRCMALESLCGIADIFSRDNGHNVYFYQRPKDGKMLALPWDWDFAFIQATNAPLFGPRAISKLIQRPHNLRRFYAHLADIMATTFNTTHMAYWTNHYDNFTPGQDYSPILTWIGQRAAFVQSQLPTQSTLAISNAPANGTLTAADALALNGTAPWGSSTVRLSGPGGTVDVDFSSVDNWSATMPLLLGTNVVTLTGFDVNGNVTGTQTFSIVSTALTFIDDDADGLPDAWEKTNGLQLLPNATAATADTDGDGQSNAAEYLTGTDPRNPASVLTMTATGQVTLTYTALAGRSYRITYRDSLTTGTWLPLTTRAATNTDTTVQFTDTPGSTQRFYRLQTP